MYSVHKMYKEYTMYTRCIQDVYMMYTRCVQDVYMMYTRYIHYTRCIHDVYKMYTSEAIKVRLPYIVTVKECTLSLSEWGGGFASSFRRVLA